MKFTWYGKENAIIESMTPSTGALRPDKESSKNWDDTENLYIEGDNLEVLKLLQKSYFGKVKMIYIDPPYNTGKDFVYKDNFKDNITNYKEITKQTTKANPETNGRYHTDWLNMMYPRLKLARNLLKEDGVIFISINDKEESNLTEICNEVFGEENFLSKLIWLNKEGGGSSDSKYFRIKHEYILCYSKEIDKVDILGVNINNIERYTMSDEYIDIRGPYYLQKLGMGSIQYSSSLDYPILMPDGSKIMPIDNNNGKKACWRWSKSKFKWGLENGFIEIKKDPKNIWTVYTKQYLNCDNNGNIIQRTQRPTGIIDDHSSTQASKFLDELGIGMCFKYSKPIGLLNYLIQRVCSKGDLILDFFSGSATTANSVLELNKDYGSAHKYIMVQLPELTEVNSEAYKLGYKNICEIGKERIRRAGDKIVSENKGKEGIENLDIGFKVFKLEYNCGGENYSMMEEGIKVDIIKRPKDKPICKFKVYGELYYLVKTNEDIIVFPYKSSIKGKVIASIFNIKLCKNKDYMQLEYLYNMKLNEFNGEDFIHSQYVTSVILDNVYKNLNE